MLQIGLTGNIGSGKTTICKIFEILGVPVFYADLQARTLLQQEDVKTMIAEAFGSKVVEKSGVLDRKALAAIVFNHKGMLQKLNEIIHPLVREKYKKWVAAQLGQPYVIQEAAILFETGLASQFNKVIVVAAPLNIRIDRVMKRDGVTRSEVLRRAANQFDQEYLLCQAHFVIHNDNSQLVIPRVLDIDNSLRSLKH